MIQQCKKKLYFGIWGRQGHTCHLKNYLCHSTLSQFHFCVSSPCTKISICQSMSHGWITYVEQQLFLDHIPWTAAFHELQKRGEGLFLLHTKEYSAAPLRILHLWAWLSLSGKCRQQVLNGPGPLGSPWCCQHPQSPGSSSWTALCRSWERQISADFSAGTGGDWSHPLLVLACIPSEPGGLGISTTARQQGEI